MFFYVVGRDKFTSIQNNKPILTVQHPKGYHTVKIGKKQTIYRITSGLITNSFQNVISGFDVLGKTIVVVGRQQHCQ